MINRCCCIIFSKDRPLQLYATLESLKKNIIGDYEVYVLFKVSSYLYEKSYRKVKFKFPKCIFYQEKNFKEDLLNIISNPYYNYILFSVDDNIFYKEIKLLEVFNNLEYYKEAIGFSLRLGENIDYCYMLNKYQKLQNYFKKDNIMYWDWKEERYDFNYCLEVSSSIYRRSFIKEILFQIDFKNPNSLEYKLNIIKNKYIDKYPWILSFTTSRSFCNPINICQDMFTQNRHMIKEEYKIENLLKLFLENKRIQINYNINIRSPHTEFDLNLIHKTNG